MDIYGALLDYGMSGIFLAFMVWNWFDAQKRSDKQVANFMSANEKLRKEYDEKEQSLRDRYDSVITGLNEERTVVRSNIAGQVKRLMNDVSTLKDEVSKTLIEAVATGQGIKDTNTNLEKVNDQIKRVVENIEQLQKDVTVGMNLMQEMQQEQKLKDVARQLAFESQSKKDK